MPPLKIKSREHRRRRLRRHGRRAYIRSAYSLPSLATLGNAICGFGSMYVASLRDVPGGSNDPWRDFFAAHHFFVAAYLIFAAMLFDAVDGRLARFTRHTTDFGGQLDSLADVISFGAAPAFLALQVLHSFQGDSEPYSQFAPTLSRMIWAVGALYVGCAAIRLARFNVSNDHGEQHHFSFLGLPSPGAGGAVASLVLMQQDLHLEALRLGTGHEATFYAALSNICLALLPVLVLSTGLLMVSHVRYPHLVNRYLRGKRSLGRLVFVLVILLIFVVAHRYAMGIGMLIYVIWGVTGSSYLRLRRRPASTATVPRPLLETEVQPPSADPAPTPTAI